MYNIYRDLVRSSDMPVGNIVQVKAAKSGDEIRLTSESSWDDPERGTIDKSYFSGPEMNRGIIRRNHGGQTKFFVCFAEAAAQVGVIFDDRYYGSIKGTDITSIPCDWMEIPDHIWVEIIRHKAAEPTDEGFRSWVQDKLPFGQKRPQQRIAGLPVPLEREPEVIRPHTQEPSVYYGEEVIEQYGSDLVPVDRIVDVPAEVDDPGFHHWETEIPEEVVGPPAVIEEPIEGEFRILNGEEPEEAEVSENGDRPSWTSRVVGEGAEEFLYKGVGRDVVEDAKALGRKAGDLWSSVDEEGTTEDGKARGGTARFIGRQLKRAGQYGTSLGLSTLRSSETGQLKRLASVQAGQNIMFVADEGVHGIERGDRGTVRMGPRGKDKVVYIPDTGEIKYPSQWTMVSLIGMIQSPESGVLNLGLGTYGERQRYPAYPGSQYMRGSMRMPAGAYPGQFQGPDYDVPVQLPSGHTMSPRAWSELSNEMKIKLGGGINLVGGNASSSKRQAFLAQYFPGLSGASGAYAGQIPYGTSEIGALRHQLERTQGQVFGTPEEAGVVPRAAARSRGKITASIKTQEDGTPYIEAIMPWQRLMTAGQADRTRAKGVVIEGSKVLGLIDSDEQRSISRLEIQIRDDHGIDLDDVRIVWKSSGESFAEKTQEDQLMELLGKESGGTVGRRSAAVTIDRAAEASQPGPQSITFHGEQEVDLFSGIMPDLEQGSLSLEEDFYGATPFEENGSGPSEEEE